MAKPASPPSEHIQAIVGTLIIAVMMIMGIVAGYSVGLKMAPVKYVDRVVKEPYEQLVEVPVLTPVPGPTVYVPVPGRTVIRRVSVPTPRYCPRSLSVADALNEYEAFSLR